MKSWLRRNVTGLFGVLSVFGRRIKGMIQLRPEQIVHICSGRNRISPSMRRQNTDSTPNKPVTLPRNQLLIRYSVTSPVHTVTVRCYAVTLQVCTHPKVHKTVILALVLYGCEPLLQRIKNRCEDKVFRPQRN